MLTPPGAVLLDHDEAAYIAEALRLLGRLLAEQADQPTARLASLTARLAKAAETGRDATPNGSERLPMRAPGAAGVHARDYATVTVAEAARIIGCGQRNVRDLIRRDRLIARRSGGTWLLDAAAVEAHAARRAARRSG
ncbi:helix-turn-helix domain-containing protein [Mycolicibacterium mengxianglii]|uniref:helix-turn-helix domain-containing protein n=1 Tax=Mycolicibacterium mengxianglii TaxID=2736649 RepID=UPI0018D16CC4|nr:helix-turn-helix domain-containing protein [Mycolicibacterium mengxianglii]